jgi:hypothetical protein
MPPVGATVADVLSGYAHGQILVFGGIGAGDLGSHFEGTAQALTPQSS